MILVPSEAFSKIFLSHGWIKFRQDLVPQVTGACLITTRTKPSAGPVKSRLYLVTPRIVASTNGATACSTNSGCASVITAKAMPPKSQLRWSYCARRSEPPLARCARPTSGTISMRRGGKCTIRLALSEMNFCTRCRVGGYRLPSFGIPESMAWPLAVNRYFCLLLFGLSGMVISMSPTARAGCR